MNSTGVPEVNGLWITRAHVVAVVVTVVSAITVVVKMVKVKLAAARRLRITYSDMPGLDLLI